MASDGRLWFNTKIDNSGVAKDLKDLERQIRKSQTDIPKLQGAKLPFVNQADELNKKLIEAKQHLKSLKNDYSAAKTAMLPGGDPEDYIRASADLPTLENAIKSQKAEVEALRKQWRAANDKVKEYDRKILQANTDIERATEKAAELNAKLATPNQIKTARAMEKADKAASKFSRRLWEIGKSALIFNLVSSGLRSVVNYMGTALKSNSQYTAQLARLKGAWLTAFQPIYDFVLPGLLAIMRVLTAMGNALANVLSFLSGKSATETAKNAQALYQQASAIGSVGDAAEEAKKQLMGFDEINRLESLETGGGVSSTGTVAPDFSGITDMQTDLRTILELVAAIGAGLLTWKIASMFTDSLATSAGLGIAVGGAMLYAFSWADAFANGINWENLSGMLAGLALVVAGLYIAFGGVGAAIGLLIGSIGIIVAAFMEFSETGEVTDEMLVALALGIIGVFAAISLLTGNPLPLLIGLLLSACVAAGTMSDGFRAAVETAMNWILALWDGLQQFFEWLAGSWNNIWGGISSYQMTGTIGDMSGYSMPSVRSADVPALARGAVIPPNREFMAVLGDQKHGTNIEAPEELIRKIVREETAGMGDSDRLAQLLELLIATVEGIEVGDETIGKAAARYNRSTARAGGL